MALKLYGLTKCSTCQKAVSWFDENKIAHSFSDVKENPVTVELVASWSKALGGWEKMINRAGYTWRGLPVSETSDLTEAKAVALAVKNPSLIRRPLIEYQDGSVTVGFSKKVMELLSYFPHAELRASKHEPRGAPFEASPGAMHLGVRRPIETHPLTSGLVMHVGPPSPLRQMSAPLMTSTLTPAAFMRRSVSGLPSTIMA